MRGLAWIGILLAAVSGWSYYGGDSGGARYSDAAENQPPECRAVASYMDAPDGRCLGRSGRDEQKQVRSNTDSVMALST
jgi:hypothetical protein